MNKTLTLLICFLVITFTSRSQYLVKQWDRTFGGSNYETLTSFSQTADSGYLVAGFSLSNISGEVSEDSRGGRDFWIVKTDTSGNKIWDKKFGGNAEDHLLAASQTYDGGYILGGWTTSDSGTGEVTQRTRGSLDFWMVKTDDNGIKQWDKRYGGSDFDWCNIIQQTSDGGYILGGWTFSDSSEDVSEHTRGGEDFWVVRTDQQGNKLWDKRFGGSQTDELFYLKETFDGGFILGGKTSSGISGDVTQAPRGDNDYWIVKINATGNKLWDKRFGGNDKDNLIALDETFDHGLILGGFTWSDLGGDISQSTRDTSTSLTSNRGDLWIIKTDSAGTKLWDKRFGGSWIEEAMGYVRQTSDSGFILGGSSYSNISGDKSENNFGFEQVWLIKTDASGVKQWDKTLFTNAEDEYAYPIETFEGCYAVASFSKADSTSFKTSPCRGDYDYWIVKLCETSQPQLPVANFSSNFIATCEGGTINFLNSSFNAGSFQWSMPGAFPSTSTLAEPTDVHYYIPGVYDVTLIAINAAGSDTLTQSNMITINPLPNFTIQQSADTLFAPQGYSQYQWFFNGAALVFDTNYFHVITQNGDYVALVTDSIGCPGFDTLLSVTVNTNEISGNEMRLNVYPNPAKDQIIVSGNFSFTNESEILITDIFGRRVYWNKLKSSNEVISVSKFQSGLYFVEVSGNEKKLIRKFVKE